MTNTDFDPGTTVLQDISGDYTLDPAHTRLGFSARHAMVATVRGAFTEFTGTAHVDTANPSDSKVEVSIVANSISTGQQQRDDHLRSGDFFESEQYPDITFTSTNVTRDGEDWTITGDLTIKGVTKSVEVPFEFTGSAKDPYGNTRIGFEASTEINRKDFGVNFNGIVDGGKVLVGDKVQIHLAIEAVLDQA